MWAPRRIERAFRHFTLADACLLECPVVEVDSAIPGWRIVLMLDFIDPGNPVQNAVIESLRGTLRDQCRNQAWFVSLADARLPFDVWRVDHKR